MDYTSSDTQGDVGERGGAGSAGGEGEGEGEGQTTYFIIPLHRTAS
jgi:hypothetical protein